MNEIEIKITIRQNTDESISIHTDLPSGAVAGMVCQQLSNISNGILRQIEEHIKKLGPMSENECREYVQNLTLGDIA